MTSFSIIIPTRNRPILLRRAVESALKAAGSMGEVIVVDDDSDEAAEEALADVSDDRLHLLHNRSSLAGGGSPSRNRGADAATGEVLFFLDDDDEFIDGYCEDIMSRAAQDAEFGFSARLFVAKGKNGDCVTRTETRRLPSGLISPNATFGDRTFPFSAGFWMRKQAYKTIGPMASDMKTNSDTEYCCRLFANGLKGWFSQSPGVRIYDAVERPASEADSVTRRTKAADRADAFSAIAEKHSDFLSEDASASHFVYHRLIKHSMRAGRRKEAFAAINRCSHWPERLRLYLQFFARSFVTRAGN